MPEVLMVFSVDTGLARNPFNDERIIFLITSAAVI